MKRALKGRTMFAIGLLGIGCAAGAAGAPVASGTLTVGIETDVRGFDPIQGVMGISGATVAGAVEEPLIGLDEDGKLAPHLATAWSYNATRTELTVKLREGVRFHDGTRFDAAAVAAHYNRIRDPKNKARVLAGMLPFKEAVALDEHTVRFDLHHPWFPLEALLAARNFVGLIESPAQVAAGKQLRHPVGTGPYVFKEWKGGDRIVVERNPDYWDPGRIHLERIVYRILPDPQTRYQSLKAGDIDVIWTDRGNSINDAAKDPAVVVHAYDGAGASINFLNTSKPPLDDPDVRAALAHAWSQEAIIKVSWRDTRPFVTHPFTGIVECGQAGYREHSFEKAREHLARYGKPVRLSMIHTTTPRGRELGELLQQLYRKIGVELTLVPVDQNTLVKRVFTNDYQISGWRIGDGLEVSPQIYALSHSKSRYNLTRYQSAELDAVVTAMNEASDRAVYDEKQCEAIALWNRSGHIQWRGGNRYHVLMTPRVAGIRPFRGGVPYVWYAWKEG